MTDPMTIHLDLASPQKKGNKRTQARKAAPDEQETPKRGIWPPPKKAKKEPKHERQHPTSKKHPSEGFGTAPKKGNKRTQARKAAPDEQETPKRGIWHRPPKKAKKEPKHERQHPTSKKHPSEGFGIAPKKGKALG